MKKALLPVVFMIIAIAVVLVYVLSTNDEGLAGRWDATWNADPKAYPNVPEGAVFTMDGAFTFTENGSVHIEGYGRPGCVFHADTMRHSAQWQLTGDTLHIRTAEDPYGIYYTILEKNKGSITMGLIDDITITLNKAN